MDYTRLVNVSVNNSLCKGKINEFRINLNIENIFYINTIKVNIKNTFNWKNSNNIKLIL